MSGVPSPWPCTPKMCTYTCSFNAAVLNSQILSYVSRDRIRTKFVRQLPSHPIQRTRKLLHSFVMGDETIVVILHDKSRLIERWDEKLAKLVDNQCILSCPTVSDKGRPRFPTLRVRSTGSIARDDSKEFKLHDDPSYQCVFPSVCCCAELIGGGHLLCCAMHSTSPHPTQTPFAVFRDDTWSPIRRCSCTTNVWKTVSSIRTKDAQKLPFPWQKNELGSHHTDPTTNALPNTAPPFPQNWRQRRNTSSP